MHIYNYKIPVSNGLLVDAYAKHMFNIYLGDIVAHPAVGICLVYTEHIQYICPVYVTYIHALYHINLVYLFNIIINRKCI